MHQSPPQIEFPPPPPPPRPQRPAPSLNYSGGSSTFGTPTFNASNALSNSPSLDHVSTFRSFNPNDQHPISMFKPQSFNQPSNNVSSFSQIPHKKNAPILPPPPFRFYQKDDYEQGKMNFF